MHLNKKVENLVAHSRIASLHLDAQQNFKIYAGLNYFIGTKKDVCINLTTGFERLK